MLTPMDIHEHQFKKAFRGYSENEVDDFLDRIVDDFEKILRENERLKNQIYANEKELEHFRKMEKTLNDTLMVAQRTADEVISAARRNADELKEDALRDGQNIRDKAQFEAQKVIDSANFEAQKLIDGANMKRDAILAEYEKFVREKNAFLMKLRTILESELTITVQMLEDVPKIEEAIKRIPPEEKIPAPAEEPPKPAEEPEKVEEVAEPEEIDEPVKIYTPVKKSEPAEEVDELPNLVDVSTKPVTEEKSQVTDETKTYKPVKPAPKLKKESSN